MGTPEFRYTCKEYREEMMLLNLQRRLHEGNLSEEEEQHLKESITRLKQEMDML